MLLSLSDLFVRVFEVAERIDANPEEIKQDIKDAIEATRGYIPGEGISVLATHERMREEGKL